MQRAGDILFTLYMGMSATVMGIVLLPLAIFGANVARRAPKIWARSVLFVLRTVSGVGYRIEGDEHLPRQGALVAANHQSIWETVALYALLPNPSFILKKELLAIPVYGWWARLTGNIPVDRAGGAKALRAMRRTAQARIAEGCQVVVFPEGTRTAPGAIKPFHPGVAGIYASVDAPCAPVAHDSGRFWRHPGIEKRPGVITLRFLPPIAPGLDRRAFLTTLEDRIKRARPDLAAGERVAAEPLEAVRHG
ncbi:MAG: lysophospholipid acyltransferase family protein [Pseudomonadota bacterium]